MVVGAGGTLGARASNPIKANEVLSRQTQFLLLRHTDGVALFPNPVKMGAKDVVFESKRG